MHAKLYSECFRSKYAYNKQPPYLSFKIFWAVYADNRAFSTILKQLFDLVSVQCFSYEKETKRYQLQRPLLWRYIGKKLPYHISQILFTATCPVTIISNPLVEVNDYLCCEVTCQLGMLSSGIVLDRYKILLCCSF